MLFYLTAAWDGWQDGRAVTAPSCRAQREELCVLKACGRLLPGSWAQVGSQSTGRNQCWRSGQQQGVGWGNHQGWDRRESCSGGLEFQFPLECSREASFLFVADDLVLLSFR